MFFSLDFNWILHILSFQVKIVLLLLEDLLVLINQGVWSFASPSDDNVGTLPIRPEILLIFLPCSRNNALQDQVSGLKFACLHLPVVHDSNLLLVCCDADLGLLLLFIWLIQDQAKLCIILVSINPFHAECRHVDVDRDDRFYSIYQWELGFARRDTLGGSIGSEHSGEFLGPFALCSIQAFVQAIEDGSNADLSLTIALRIIGHGESMGHGESIGNLILSAEAGHLLAGKDCPVVGDNGVGKPKPTHYILPKKFDNLLSSDFEE